MTNETCSKTSQEAQVISVRELGGEGFVLRVNLENPFAEPLEGGHFFMLRTEDRDFPFLNRPFSVHAAFPSSQGPQLEFLFKTVGPGTRCLAALQPGEAVQLIGPLGQPFPFGNSEQTTILVAGGVGLPPLHFYLQRQQELARDEPTIVLYGARNESQLFDLSALQQRNGELRTATDDGSYGHHGQVDSLLLAALDELGSRPVRILTCGPDPMMERVAEIAIERHIECYVSLETMMACGFGVCNVCAVKIRQSKSPGYRYARSCLEGPVMEAAQILWH